MGKPPAKNNPMPTNHMGAILIFIFILLSIFLR